MPDTSGQPSASIPIATLGGGSGQFVLLSSLRDFKQLSISAIVSMTDSGGSTGRLRDEYGVLPPGDILKCILALSPQRDMARSILLKRFSEQERLRGHSAGNMLLTMLSQYTGSFSDGIQGLAELLDVDSEILPVTTDKSTLVAVLTNGDRIFGESAIDLPRGNQREKIADVFLVPHHGDQIRVHPPVIERIGNVKAIILGPGDLYTSIIPNLLVPGVKQALQQTEAKLVYVSSIMTKFGETEGYALEQFIEELESYIGRQLDVIVHNNRMPDQALLDNYQRQRAAIVGIAHPTRLKTRYQVIAADMLEQDANLVRHSIFKLAKALVPFLLDLQTPTSSLADP